MLVGLQAHAHRGELTALFGPSGAGKSALLACLAGALKPERGQLEVAGGSPQRALTRQALGYQPQGIALHFDLSVEDNLRTFAAALGLRDLEAAVGLALEAAWLTKRRHERVRDLSHGHQLRASLAVALLGQAELLLLDEPFSCAEPAFRDATLGLLRARAAAGAGVVIATQDPRLALACDRVIFLRAGRAVGELRPAEALAQGPLEVELTFRERTGPRVERHRLAAPATELPGLILRLKPSEVQLRHSSPEAWLLKAAEEACP